jgi:hypothetical protein
VRRRGLRRGMSEELDSDLTDPFVCPCCGADATKLRIAAEFMEALDAIHLQTTGTPLGTEAQDDLRAWADRIEDGP